MPNDTSGTLSVSRLACGLGRRLAQVDPLLMYPDRYAGGIMQPYMQLSHVTKQFGPLPVIADISLSLDAGEIVSLVGPSGCGKSTLLRIIAGVEHVSSGTIRHQIPPDRIGFVFQDVRLLPWRSALQNISFVLRDRIADGVAREAYAQQTLQRVGLADFSGYLPQQLSGGMQKRVAIARALAIDAELILFDEPFSDLDLPLRLLLIEEIAQMLKEGNKMAVYVTHDIREALILSDRVYVLSARPTRIRQTVLLHAPPGQRQHKGSLTPELRVIEAEIIAALQQESLEQPALAIGDPL
ncbi:MAG: ABC transporter ATP-binding protein [Chloroflexia bacterium]|nr:ABC transporter ATP-binding protein [Chloroflexia bacterium]